MSTPSSPESQPLADKPPSPPGQAASTASIQARQRFGREDLEQTEQIARQQLICLVETLNDEQVGMLRRYLAAEDHLNAARIQRVRDGLNDAAGDMSLLLHADILIRATGRTVYSPVGGAR